MPNDTPLSHSVRDQVSADEWRARIDLAACYRLLARYRMDDLVGTHTSLVVPGSDGKHFLINPYGVLFEQVTASSLVKIDCDGNPVMRSPHTVNQAGFIIHSAIHMARPNALCVMHTHTVAGMAVSMQAHGLLPASQHALSFTGNIAYHDIEHIVAGIDGREKLAQDLGECRALIMRNHGLLVCGETVADAFCVMHALEKSCAAQVAALSGGGKLYPVSDMTARWFGSHMAKPGYTASRGAVAWPSLLRVLDDTDPSYRD